MPNNSFIPGQLSSLLMERQEQGVFHLKLHIAFGVEVWGMWDKVPLGLGCFLASLTI